MGPADGFLMANRLNCAMGDMLPDHHCLTYYPYNPLILPPVPPNFWPIYTIIYTQFNGLFMMT